MQLQVIIPVVDERENLKELLPLLLIGLNGRGRITVADGGSQDGTAELLAREFPTVRHLHCTRKGRAGQMNEAATLALPQFYGTVAASAQAFYFVHADTRPPATFYRDIKTGIDRGEPVGCYRFTFDSRHPLLKINAFCTRFRWLAGRGGDQSLYVSRPAWEQLGGFRNMKIMEDYDIIQRVWRAGIPFRIIPKDIVVSARKYRANSWLRVQLANYEVFSMYRKGAPEEEMVSRYRELLRPW